MKRLTALAALAVLASPAAQAQTASPPRPSLLSLSAHGEAKAPPDLASLTVGVEVTAASAAAAMAEDSAQMDRVIAAVKRAGVPPRDIVTSRVSLAPQYVYVQNQPARLTGYQAANEVAVTVEDLAKLGGVIDAAVTAGATNVGAVNFDFANPVSAANTARVAAMKALQDKAALYAELTGYHIVRLVDLSEGEAPFAGPRPMMLAAQAKFSPAPPVEPGELTVGIDVSATFEIAH